MILTTAVRCPECGVHFQGEAGDFLHRSEQIAGAGRIQTWVFVVAVLLLGALLLSVFGLP